MRQLPGTGRRQDGQLDHGPADDAGVGGLGLVAELGLALLQREKSMVNIGRVWLRMEVYRYIGPMS